MHSQWDSTGIATNLWNISVSKFDDDNDPICHVLVYSHCDPSNIENISLYLKTKNTYIHN